MHAQNCTPGAAVTPRAAHRSGQPEHITTPRPAACPPMADAGRGDGEPPTASPDPAPAQAQPAPLEKSESKKAFRGLRKQMSKLTGVRGVISKPSSAEP